MDYEKLLLRGRSYVQKSGSIWYGRHNDLVHIWGNMHDGKIRNRIGALIRELETRVNMAGRIIYKLEEIKKQKDIEIGNMLIYLECNKYACKNNPKTTGVVVKYSEYQDGKYLCDTCGGVISIKGELDIKITLKELGIDFG